ncbi:MAG: hypothetical protein EOP47_14455 [Sphingobacteriaceae bacterium]|nr:MAG: hypothetical protein EOP47_14455 [Sphingobacteriaceae bacterium]
MKKILSIFSILAFTISTYSQGLKPVKIDSLVTVSLPAKYDLKDTAGQKIFSGNGSMGYMIVIRTTVDNAPLKKEKDLNNVFKEYMKKVQSQSSGSILDSRDTTIGDLKAKVFGLETDDQNGVEIRNFTVLYTKEALYTFEYVYPSMRKDNIKEENKAFFSSISISSDLHRTDQYTNTTATGLSPVGRIAIFGGGGLVLLLIGYFVYRKKTETAMS